MAAGLPKSGRFLVMGLRSLVSEFVRSDEVHVRKQAEVLKVRVNGQIVEAKLCAGCDIVKPLVQFHSEKNGVGGRKSKCNKCRSGQQNQQSKKFNYYL
jgi:hypothetical protein